MGLSDFVLASGTVLFMDLPLMASYHPRVCTALPGSPAIVTLGRDVSLCYFPSLLGVCVLFSLMYLGR